MSGGAWPDYSGPAAKAGEPMAREVRFAASKWSRLTAADVAGLESSDDLVTVLVAKYGLDAAQAEKIVEAAMRVAHR